MNIQEMHYDFKFKLDKVDSQSRENFNVAEIDWILNRAQEVFVKRRYSPNNLYRLGFEGNQKRIDDLSTLVVKYPEQPDINLIQHDNTYELPLDELKYPYYFFLQGEVEVVEPNCIKFAKMKYIQHDDLNFALEDPFNNSTSNSILFNFGRSSDGTTSSIYLYPATETLSKARITYLKQPRQLSFGTYTYINGVTLPEQSSELPEHTHAEIVDIAVELASTIIEDPNFVQIKRSVAMTSE